jgi:hypothetical protein
MDEAELTLSIIEQLLRKYGNRSRADIVADSLEELSIDGPSSYRVFATLDWWGGSGSIADVHLMPQREQPSDEQKLDNQLLRSSLLDLYNLMLIHGVEMKEAARWAEVFQEWEEKDI